MIFAETDRLWLRELEEGDLLRLVKMLDVWEMVRWLSVMPFPYTIRDAERFYFDMQAFYKAGEPQFYALATKGDNLLIGGIGLHVPRNRSYEAGDLEIGYWLGMDFWGRGFMSEAMIPAVDIGFSRLDTSAIIATTSPENISSQKVLARAGLRNTGMFLRDYEALRGGDTVIGWRLTRAEYEAAREPIGRE